MQTCPSNGPVTLEALINQDRQVVTSCTLAYGHIVVDAGLFDESFRRCEDYDLWLRVLYRNGQMAYQRKVLGRYRSHPGYLSCDAMKMLEHLAAINEKPARTKLLPEETRAMLRKQIAQAQAYFDLESGRKFLTSGDFDRAKDSLTKANEFLNRTKFKLAILGLRVAPILVRWGMLAWQKFVLGSGIAKPVQDLHAD